MRYALGICLVSGGLAAATACGSNEHGYPSEQPLVDGTSGETTGSLAEKSGATDEGSNEPEFTEETCLSSHEYVVHSSLTDTRGTGFSALEVLAIFNETRRGVITWQDGTTSRITATASVLEGNGAELEDPPRYQGYCTPRLSVPVQLSVETADTRLSEVIVTTLTAAGHDGIIETIFLADAWLPIDDLRGKLQIPADWLIAEHSVRRLDLDLEWTRAGETGAYCLTGEARSADPAEDCNTCDGVLRFFSSVEDPWADENATPDEVFYGVIGWWTLDD